jgi:hypothetical protein
MNLIIFASNIFGLSLFSFQHFSLNNFKYSFSSTNVFYAFALIVHYSHVIINEKITRYVDLRFPRMFIVYPIRPLTVWIRTNNSFNLNLSKKINKHNLCICTKGLIYLYIYLSFFAYYITVVSLDSD